MIVTVATALALAATLIFITHCDLTYSTHGKRTRGLARWWARCTRWSRIYRTPDWRQQVLDLAKAEQENHRIREQIRTNTRKIDTTNRKIATLNHRIHQKQQHRTRWAGPPETITLHELTKPEYRED